MSPSPRHVRLAALALLTACGIVLFRSFEGIRENAQRAFPTQTWHLGPATIDTCSPCETSPEVCQQYGSRNLELSRAFDGSGDRVHRMFEKLSRGLPIATAVLGGSGESHSTENSAVFPLNESNRACQTHSVGWSWMRLSNLALSGI